MGFNDRRTEFQTFTACPAAGSSKVNRPPRYKDRHRSALVSALATSLRKGSSARRRELLFLRACWSFGQSDLGGDGEVPDDCFRECLGLRFAEAASLGALSDPVKGLPKKYLPFPNFGFGVCLPRSVPIARGVRVVTNVERSAVDGPVLSDVRHWRGR